jgi:hypothetical protein
MVETVHTSETWSTPSLHGATSQKALIFILAAVRTLNLTNCILTYTGRKSHAPCRKRLILYDDKTNGQEEEERKNQVVLRVP